MNKESTIVFIKIALFCLSTIMLTTFSVKSMAQLCPSSLAGKCGVAGGCDSSDEICKIVEGTTGVTVYSCQPQESSDQCAEEEETSPPPTSCSASTVGQCNAAGGCMDGQKCENIAEGSPFPNYQCQPNSSCSPPPATTVCSVATVGQCAASGGCPSGQKCTNVAEGSPIPNYQCMTDSSCGAPPETSICGYANLNECNTAGGCQAGWRCVDLGEGTPVHNYACKLDSTCPIPVTCNASLVDRCGAQGGCDSPTKRCKQIGYTWGCVIPVAPELPCITPPDDDGDPIVGVTPYNGPILSLDDIVKYFYAIALPIGIIFGMYSIIKAGYTLKTSEGNPQKIKDGQDELTAAILGTLFIMLSLVILRVIIRSIIGVSTPGF